MGDLIRPRCHIDYKRKKIELEVGPTVHFNLVWGPTSFIIILHPCCSAQLNSAYTTRGHFFGRSDWSDFESRGLRTKPGKSGNHFSHCFSLGLLLPPEKVGEWLEPYSVRSRPP